MAPLALKELNKNMKILKKVTIFILFDSLIHMQLLHTKNFRQNKYSLQI